MEEHDHEYAEALQELIDEGTLVEGTAAHGVAMQALHSGHSTLTGKQSFVYERFVASALKKKTCSICGEFASYFDGKRLCGYHRNQIEKSDRDD